MPFGHNVVSKGKPEACALAGRLGRKEGLEDLIADTLRYAAAIVGHMNFN